MTYMYFFPLFTTEDTPVHSSVASMESQSGLRGSSTTTASDLTNIPPSHPQFQRLSSSEKEELMIKLYEDEKNMKLLFASLVTATCYSIQKRIPVVDFAGYILALRAYEPAPEERDQSLLDEHIREIKGAKSISEIFIILTPYWNYLSYEILEYIIAHYGTSEDTERLRKYDKKLHNFCKRRIFELPVESGSGIGNEQSLRQKKVCVMLNVHEDLTAGEIFRIRRKIAKILQVNPSTLFIQHMDGRIAQLQTSEGQP